MTDDERAARGRRAGQEYRELERAFQMVGDKLNAEMLALSPGHPGVIDKHRELHSLGAVRKALLAIAQDGMMAAAVLEKTSPRD